MLRQDDFVRSQLVLVGWREGLEYGGHLASCMVMSCIANRVRLGWGSWLEVIDRIPKFSAVTDQPNKNLFPSVWDANFVRLLHEVEAIFDGSQDYSKGALYWADTRRIETPFFQEKIMSQPEAHARICDMNSFACFR